MLDSFFLFSFLFSSSFFCFLSPTSISFHYKNEKFCCLKFEAALEVVEATTIFLLSLYEHHHHHEKEKQEQSRWADLTHECVVNILNRLTIEDRWRGTMFVCKSWFHVSKDPCLHTVLDLESSFETRRAESVRWWNREFETKIDNMVRSVVDWSDGGVAEIRVRHCSDRAISLVAQRCPNLKILSIKSSPNVTDESLLKLALGCPKLRELDISYCYEISHESIAMLGRKCANIVTLRRNLMNWLDPSEHIGVVPADYLNACPQDGNSEAAAIGNFMPQLLHLELQFSKLTSRGLSLITEGCKNLEYLDLSGCVNVTSQDIVNFTSKLTNLKNIKKPNFYMTRSGFHTERYGHWRLYDERFQTDAFRI